MVHTEAEYSEKTTGKSLLLDRITAYMEENLEKRITLKQLAAEFDVSISTVTQTFQKKGNTTFHDFLTQRRMEKARMLILNGVSLETAGRMVGYRNHSTFYRAFRKHFDLSPREYRRSFLQDTKE